MYSDGVSIAALDSQRQRYSFNVDKTKIVSLNSKNDPSCLLSKEPIAMSTCETHLGISRNNKNTNKDTINARIINARRAMYSLMGAGLHGLNGVGPEVLSCSITYMFSLLSSMVWKHYISRTRT